MSEFQASNFKKENGGTPDLLGKTEFTSPYFFVPPSGTTEERPQNCAPGTIRFNTDVGTLEIYKGDTIGWEYIQKKENQYLNGGTRGLFMGGSPNGNTNIDEITIPILGSYVDFGDLSVGRHYCNATSSSVRAVNAGGVTPSITDVIDFVNFSQRGNAQDFGNLSTTRASVGACANSTRGLFMSGWNPYGANPTDTIEYVTIATTGDAVDFGNSTDGRAFGGGCQSSVRGIHAGGTTNGAPSYGTVNTIDFVTTASLGDATDFGDLSAIRSHPGGASNATRGLFCGGYVPGNLDVIDFITIATLGNAIDFGNFIASGNGLAGVASPTRAVFGGAHPSPYNNYGYVEFATTGNAKDFGDLSGNVGLGGASNGHGGL